MKTSDFFYELPEELIAQTPIEPRNSSKLMILNKKTGEIQHRIFSDLTSCLNENDCLVLNDTRVIPARIYGVKEDTGAVVEFLLVAQKENDVWECLCKPGKRAKIGTNFSFGDGKLIGELEEKGIDTAYVTLHVGLGTFRPVKVDDVTKHHMHTEHYIMPQETADIINETKKNGGRVISVGTTSCRTLESVAAKNGCICRDEGDTSIFIYPGFDFKCIDALITNFHLPESTLIMLVSAFAGFDNVMNAYNTAVKEKYRFFSFGDSMFIC